MSNQICLIFGPPCTLAGDPLVKGILTGCSDITVSKHWRKSGFRSKTKRL